MAKIPDFSVKKTGKELSDQRRRNIINAIHDCLEDGRTESGISLNEWGEGFLEDISKLLSQKKTLSIKQYETLTNIIGFNFLK
jgi:hypothetical protein